MDSLRVLEQKLGHKFAEPGLLREAVTHSSAEGLRTRALVKGKISNEKLEFLGDRVLGLVVAEIIFRRYPRATEGELSRRLMALVCETHLAEVARQLELGPFLILSEGAENGGIQRQNRALADAVEAIIAALYLDGGFAAAQNFIRLAWAQSLDNPATAERDPKSSLQEWGQGRGIGLPVYKVVQISGSDHAPRFSATVRLGEAEAAGEGATKKEAQIAAARALLTKLEP
ncbi:MAG: ribonuclease III [Alphaproteobacteria bacterium]|nr:ribonuclease III [Alphaproteobacteria bacterium]